MGSRNIRPREREAASRASWQDWSRLRPSITLAFGGGGRSQPIARVTFRARAIDLMRPRDRPDFSAMSRSCVSTKMRAGRSPSRPRDRRPELCGSNLRAVFVVTSNSTKPLGRACGFLGHGLCFRLSVLLRLAGVGRLAARALRFAVSFRDVSASPASFAPWCGCGRRAAGCSWA